MVSYSFFVLPGGGNFGPYQLNSWSINGQTQSIQFNTIPDLVNYMNIWDTNSTWIFDPGSMMVTGGNASNSYTNMNITQINTAASAILEVNANLVPTQTTMYLDQGINEVIFTHNQTGCSDTVTVTVTCLGPDYLYDTIFVNTTDTMCIPTDELLGNIVSYENSCEDSSGEFVIFNQVDGTWCAAYEGVDIGVDSSCIVLCDDLGFCDTTYLFVSVIPEERGELMPDAIADVDTIPVNTISVVSTMDNDSINGVFDTIYLLTPPNFGTVIFDEDGNGRYTPNEDYCDAIIADEYSYVLCNTVGCDTTTVSIYVVCDGLTIYTGFSPNNDGVNDVFFIEGVENFPDNELSIFNRWGNEVYFEQGYLNTWDGTWKGKLLPDGTYFYVFDYKNSNGEVIELSGYVQIHR